MMKSLDEYVDDLEAENLRLKERNKYLKDHIHEILKAYILFTKTEHRLLEILYRSDRPLRVYEITQILYPKRRLLGNPVSVLLTHIRKKMKSLGYAFGNGYVDGYCLPHEVRTFISAWYQ